MRERRTYLFNVSSRQRKVTFKGLLVTFPSLPLPYPSPELHNIADDDVQELLWGAVLAGDIDMVVSDHSPCTPDLKLPGEKDFMAAWGGISSLQFGNYQQ